MTKQNAYLMDSAGNLARMHKNSTRAQELVQKAYQRAFSLEGTGKFGHSVDEVEDGGPRGRWILRTRQL